MRIMANGTKNRAEIVYRVRIFRVKHNRLYCGDLFTIHSPLVFDLQSRSVFCVCVWFGLVLLFSFWVLSSWMQTMTRFSAIQNEPHFIFDANENGSAPNHMSLNKVRYWMIQLLRIQFGQRPDLLSKNRCEIVFPFVKRTEVGYCHNNFVFRSLLYVWNDFGTKTSYKLHRDCAFHV